MNNSGNPDTGQVREIYSLNREIFRYIGRIAIDRKVKTISNIDIQYTTIVTFNDNSTKILYFDAKNKKGLLDKLKEMESEAIAELTKISSLDVVNYDLKLTVQSITVSNEEKFKVTFIVKNSGGESLILFFNHTQLAELLNS